jgi:hypothetical protein
MKLRKDGKPDRRSMKLASHHLDSLNGTGDEGGGVKVENEKVSKPKSRASTRACAMRKPGGKYKTPKETHLAARMDQMAACPAGVTPNLVAYLVQEFPPEYIAAKIRELMEATHTTKGGKQIVDYRAREAGVKLALAYIEGTPIGRQQVMTVSVDSLDELQRRAQGSPALRTAVARLAGQRDGEEES